MSRDLPDIENIKSILNDNITDCLKGCLSGVYVMKLSIDANINICMDDRQRFVLDIHSEDVLLNKDGEMTPGEQHTAENGNKDALVTQDSSEMVCETTGEAHLTQLSTTPKRRSKRIYTKVESGWEPAWLKEALKTNIKGKVNSVINPMADGGPVCKHILMDFKNAPF